MNSDLVTAERPAFADSESAEVAALETAPWHCHVIFVTQSNGCEAIVPSQIGMRVDDVTSSESADFRFVEVGHPDVEREVWSDEPSPAQAVIDFVSETATVRLAFEASRAPEVEVDPSAIRDPDVGLNDGILAQDPTRPERQVVVRGVGGEGDVVFGFGCAERRQDGEDAENECFHGYWLGGVLFSATLGYRQLLT